MFSQHKDTAIKQEQRDKLDAIIERVKRSEDDGSYATIDGVDTVDDIWYLLDMIRNLDETVIHARGLLKDVSKLLVTTTLDKTGKNE